jgi:hypothetical protein
MTACCECGSDSDCFPVWHEALAEEQRDPTMAAWHNPLVCGFILQHPSLFQSRFADGQYRFLQLFVDRGIDAVNAVARDRTARNRGSAPAFDSPELESYESIPTTGFPATFAVSVHHMREPGGGFVGQGYAAYDARMRDFVRATIDGWRLLKPATPST